MWILVAAVVILVVRIAAAANSNWQAWLLFWHGGNLDRTVPELGGDLGYYLFKLPFLSIVSGWFRQLILITLVLTVFAYLVSGGLRPPGRGRRSQPKALAHIGLIVALFAAAEAFDYVFVRRPSLAVNTSGSFVGPGYTELHVIVPATWVLAILALVAGFALVVGARTGKWKIPLILVAVWGVAHVVGLVVAPMIVNRAIVAPGGGRPPAALLRPQPGCDEGGLPARHHHAGEPNRGRRGDRGPGQRSRPRPLRAVRRRPPPRRAAGAAGAHRQPDHRRRPRSLRDRRRAASRDDRPTRGESRRPAGERLGADPPRLHPWRRRRRRAGRPRRRRRSPRRRLARRHDRAGASGAVLRRRRDRLVRHRRHQAPGAGRRHVQRPHGHRDVVAVPARGALARHRRRRAAALGRAHR